MTDKATRIHVDVSVGNSAALLKTQMLHGYVQLDARLRSLCLAVKHWARQRKLNDPFHHTLSSYAWTLLCVHLMQLDLKGVGPFAAYKMKQDQIPSNRCPVRRRHGSRGSEAAGDTCDGGELSSPASPTDDARAEVRRCGCPHLARC